MKSITYEVLDGSGYSAGSWDGGVGNLSSRRGGQRTRPESPWLRGPIMFVDSFSCPPLAIDVGAPEQSSPLGTVLSPLGRPIFQLSALSGPCGTGVEWETFHLNIVARRRDSLV
jgi:hypothetical protein